MLPNAQPSNASSTPRERRLPRLRRLFLLGLLGLAGAIVTAGAGAGAPDRAPLAAAPPHVQRAGASVRIIGGTAAQRRLARLTALRVGGITIRRVVFRKPAPRLRREHVEGAEMVVLSSAPGTLRGEWELGLFGGTYLALSERYRDAAVGAITAGQRVGPIRQWPYFDIFGQVPRSAEVGLFTMRLDETAISAGARVRELRVAATPAREIALTLQVSDPASFLRHRVQALLDRLNRPRISLLGYYVGLRDSTGRLVWATSRLSNEGGVFAIPRLDACSPVKHSEAAGSKQLPCPVR